MNILTYCQRNYNQSIILSKYSRQRLNIPTSDCNMISSTIPSKDINSSGRRKLVILTCGNGETGKTNEKPSFLSFEEAGIVDMSGLSTHERFLCRLTISSLNLLRVVAEQEKCTIEELNAGKVCDWFLKDKLKSEQNLGSAVLQWGDPEL